MNRSVLVRAAFAAAVGVALTSPGTAHAAVINTFDSAGDTAGWTVDRYAPAVFASGQTGGGRTGVLQHGISGAAYQGPGSFYNTQGMQTNLAPGSTSLFIDLYAPAGFSGRHAGLWATGLNGASSVVNYPIIELNNGGFRIWDSTTGTWVNVGGYAGGDEWYQIGFELEGGEFVYYVNGVAVYTDTNADGVVSFGNVILQGHNTGSDYNIYWDNLNTSAVPEPATIAAFGLMLAGGGLYVRRRKAVAAV